MASNMALRDKSGRNMTRGWDGSAYVKRATSKRVRKDAKQALRDGGDGDTTKPRVKGWVW